MRFSHIIAGSITAMLAFIAQVVERFVYTEDVGGSSPSGGTMRLILEVISDTGSWCARQLPLRHAPMRHVESLP